MASTGAWIFIASRTDPLEAAKAVVNQAIDFISDRTGLSPARAYMLCSIALDLKISQWVNQPMGNYHRTSRKIDAGPNLKGVRTT